MSNKKLSSPEELRSQKMSSAMGAIIQKGRQAKGLTQRELAVKINEKQQIIKDYEAGRGVINPAVLVKIERTLGVKLRGKEIGKQTV